jgi:glycosyltransferase involved in cell wall biosynthesis
MNVLFLFPYPTGQSPSQRFRFEQYLNILEQNDILVSSQSFWDQQTWSILYKKGYTYLKIIGFIKGMARRFLKLFQLSKTDFVFIHRECLPIGPPFIEWVIAKVLKKKIIYDFDDAIWLPNTTKENKVVAHLKCHWKVSRICSYSHAVSAGNEYLVEYAKDFNKVVTLNPTTIETTALHNPNLHSKEPTDKIVIGWTGTHSTLHYLDEIVPAMIQLFEEHPDQFKLVIIADRKPEYNIPFLKFIPWSKQNEIKDLMRFDIGIMPLTDDQWARGKCGFKALQYMALEIPAIASPVGINITLIDDGINGFLANEKNEWLTILKQLLFNKELRKLVGVNGRKKVISNYSVISNSSTFLSLFDLGKVNNNAVNKKGSNGIL